MGCKKQVLIPAPCNIELPYAQSKTVFTSKMLDLELYFWPVSPTDLTLETWWKEPDIVRLLTREYAKYLTEHLRV